MGLTAGHRLGPYEVVAPLGAGGMGEVYRARDARLDRTVAVKILPPELAVDERYRQRFEREARAASALSHPHIAHVYDVGEQDGTHFIAMEYVEGENLRELVTRGPLDVDRVVEIGAQMASALEEAHGRGVVHRDIKSANAVVTPKGQVKVLDFGLARRDRDGAGALDSEQVTEARTQAGVVVGTVPYMSPEQALGKDLDARTDLFSLGVVLYELATGRLPFVGNTATQTIDQICHATPVELGASRKGVPAELERIVRKCLEKDRERRYASARDLVVDLRNLQRDRATGTGRWRSRRGGGRGAFSCSGRPASSPPSPWGRGFSTARAARRRGRVRGRAAVRERDRRPRERVPERRDLGEPHQQALEPPGAARHLAQVGVRLQGQEARPGGDRPDARGGRAPPGQPRPAGREPRHHRGARERARRPAAVGREVHPVGRRRAEGGGRDRRHHRPDAARAAERGGAAEARPRRDRRPGGLPPVPQGAGLPGGQPAGDGQERRLLPAGGGAGAGVRAGPRRPRGGLHAPGIPPRERPGGAAADGPRRRRTARSSSIPTSPRRTPPSASFASTSSGTGRPRRPSSSARSSSTPAAAPSRRSTGGS